MDVIIETPRGSNIKYKFDEKLKLFRFKKILPAGLVFPYDFGFIPDTKGEDGDPLDVLVISEFQGFPGCIMDCRIIGCIRVEQTVKKKKIRNDRFLGIPTGSIAFEHVTSINEIPGSLVSELEAFIANYLSGEGKKFRLLGNLDAKQATKLLDK